MSIQDELEIAWGKGLRIDDLKIVDAFKTDGKDASEEAIRYFAFGYLEGRRIGLAADRFDDTAENAKGIQGHVTELKPDRRAEVLKLTQTVTAELIRKGEITTEWHSIYKMTAEQIEAEIRDRSEKVAKRVAHQVLAIINAVDEATGAKVKAWPDAVSGFMKDIEAELDWLSLEIGRSMSLSEGDKPEFQRHVSKARDAWFAARGVKL